MTADSGQDGPLDLAARRLERALAMLEQRLARRLAEAGQQAGAASDQDRANLAAELDAARARERDLEEAASAAYDALAGAIAEIRQVLGEPQGAEGEA
jgi:thioesterase domain-containing protein